MSCFSFAFISARHNELDSGRPEGSGTILRPSSRALEELD